MGMKSFLGILPPRIYYGMADVPIEELPMPGRAILLESGMMPDDLVTRVGATVLTGENLARRGRSPFLSTVTGTVLEIDTRPGTDGRDQVTVTIDVASIKI